LNYQGGSNPFLSTITFISHYVKFNRPKLSARTDTGRHGAKTMAEVVEVLVPGGKATAGPPLGPALGPLGINVKAVVDEINAKTASFNGMQVPVKVEVNEKKQFTVTVGIPPTTALIKKKPVSRKVPQRPTPQWQATCHSRPQSELPA